MYDGHNDRAEHAKLLSLADLFSPHRPRCDAAIGFLGEYVYLIAFTIRSTCAKFCGKTILESFSNTFITDGYDAKSLILGRHKQCIYERLVVGFFWRRFRLNRTKEIKG